jgi:manganese transport protein
MMNSVVLGGRLRGRLTVAHDALPGASDSTPNLHSLPAFGWRRLLSFVGPGYMIAVGYMDPGNWATSLSAGSAFGYSLLSVLFLSNLLAMCLQAAAVRLGLASGLDLAQACRQRFGRRTNLALWIGCEIAIIACNLAEVLGMACGLQLLFHCPLPLGVCLTGLDVFLVLQLQHRGVRPLETFIIGLVSLIAACIALQVWWLHPSLGAVAHGLIPTADLVTRPDMLYLAVAIIGATVMPHNLYLHSSIVKARPPALGDLGVRDAIRYASIDSTLALTLALAVNIGIMVLAAGAFHHPGQAPVTELQDAYRLLAPLLGVHAASAVFGLGLVASGLSSSITGTLAGQVVMEGFLNVRVSRAVRGFVTRSVALLPALAAAAWFGNSGVGKLLVLSQVVLGLQLPFAVVPLLWFTTRRSALIGDFAFGKPSAAMLWLIAAFVIAVNVEVVKSLLWA